MCLFKEECDTSTSLANFLVRGSVFLLEIVGSKDRGRP